jgi:hypothetical protein
MRKRYRVLMIAALVAAFAARFGYGLSMEAQRSISVNARNGAAQTASAIVAAPAVLHPAMPASPHVTNPTYTPLPDAGKLLLVGTILFGLSALVRKAI